MKHNAKTWNRPSALRLAAICCLAMPAPSLAAQPSGQGDEIRPGGLAGSRARQRALREGVENEERDGEAIRRERLAELRAEQQGQAGDDSIQISQFSEPVELSLLVSFFADALQINVTQDGQLTGTVSFNAPVDIPRERALAFLDSILGDRGFTIVQDDTGWYKVQQAASVAVGLNNTATATTQVIYTRNVRPTSIQGVIQTQLSGSAARLSYIDELGLIMATGAPRQIDDVRRIVDALVAERAGLVYSRIPLEYLSAPVARQRMIDLATGTTQSRTGVGRQGVPGQDPNALGGAGGTISSLASSLRVDQQDNALIFYGREEELDEIRALAEIIDTPSRLRPVRYFTGSATQNIAQIAEETGFGEVVQLRASDPNSPSAVIEAQARAQGIIAEDNQSGGSRLVASPGDGYIVYYGTEQQHAQLEALIEQFETEADIVVTRPYKLEHADAEEVADLLQGLIQNQRPVSSDSGQLLPPGRNNQQTQRQDFQQDQAELLNQLSDDIAFNPDPDISFVIADPERNQVLVKAPVRQQDQFKKLVDAIDIRRPQVYLEVQIVSVSATDSFILSFEQQLISTSGGEGVFNTNFGSASGADITVPRTVGALTGLSAAIIDSRQVPLVVNALRSQSDTRIVASPSILVDDNEEAEIVSIRQEPTTTTRTLDSGQQITEFQGYEDAGTELLVTPRISAGEHMTLDYEIQLSRFEASDGTDAGVPPPRTENTIRADSVTIPAGMTIVVGGLKTENSSRTIAKVPLLGDIPVLGELFKRRSNSDDASTLYVFLTPTILRDPDFADYRLLTEGPQKAVSLRQNLPRLRAQLARPLEGSGRFSIFAEETTVDEEPTVFDPIPENDASDKVDALEPLPGVNRERSLFGTVDREDRRAREQEEPFERDD